MQVLIQLKRRCATRGFGSMPVGNSKLSPAIAVPLNNLEKVSKFETGINKRTLCKRVSLLLLAEGRAANFLQRKWNECFWI